MYMYIFILLIITLYTTIILHFLFKNRSVHKWIIVINSMNWILISLVYFFRLPIDSPGTHIIATHQFRWWLGAIATGCGCYILWLLYNRVKNKKATNT